MKPIIDDSPGGSSRWECSECSTYIDTTDDECPVCGAWIEWEAVEIEELGIGQFKPMRY